MRRGCLIGLWVAAAPFAWVAAWFWAGSLVDEKALGLDGAGAGPDAYDFIDMRALVFGFAVLMALWAVLLFLGANLEARLGEPADNRG